jgi:LDH2 family malate/lactate/ureidoglycolate dehydrogenase
MLAGSPAFPPELAEFGIVVITIRPDLLTSADEFAQKVSAYTKSVRAARPVGGGGPVRVPFDRSRAERRRRLAENAVDVADAVHRRLVEIASRVPRNTAHDGETP